MGVSPRVFGDRSGLTGRRLARGAHPPRPGSTTRERAELSVERDATVRSICGAFDFDFAPSYMPNAGYVEKRAPAA